MKFESRFLLFACTYIPANRGENRTSMDITRSLKKREGREEMGGGDRGREMPVELRCYDNLQWQVQEVLSRARVLNIHFQVVCA